jgi:RNA polymerase sigma-70 factor (ECF subfamily)
VTKTESVDGRPPSSCNETDLTPIKIMPVHPSDRTQEPRDESSPVRREAVVSSEDWARRLQRGDVTAVEEVRRRVVGILAHRRLAMEIGEREDLVQEVMADLWQAVRRPSFDLAGGFWGFVETVTSRRTIDRLRSRRESLPLPEQLRSHSPGPLGRALDRERAALAAEVLGSLEPACRQLVVLRLHDGLCYATIASRLGRSQGALRVQFYRCIGRARKIAGRLKGDLTPWGRRSSS